MMPKRNRQWMQIDVHYWDDPQIIEAGTEAGVIFQQLIAWCFATHSTNGVVPLAVARRLGDYKPLIDVGLCTNGSRSLSILSWDDWHHGKAPQNPTRQAADRQARKRHRDALNASKEKEQEQVQVLDKRSHVTQSVTPSRDSHVTRRKSPGQRVADAYQQLTQPDIT